MRSILSFTFLLTIIQLSSSTLYSCDHNAACGCSNNSATLTRIVGGEAAGSRTWGWAVSLLIRGALCGGSIISETWIITAAHCVRGAVASEATVYAGSNTKLSGSQIRSVSAIVPHPNYDPSTSVNDIALLEMSSPLNMSDHGISIICLPNVSSATLFAGEWPPAATTVVAVGWGRLNETGSLPSTLQQVTMQAVDWQSPKCTPVTSNWMYQMCAAASCKDTCQGDSGGPLMAFTSSNQWVLVGTTSSGIGCAREDYAGSYTRVAAYQSWISSTIGSGSFSPAASSIISSTTEVDLNARCTASEHYQSASTFSLGPILYFIVTLC